MWGDRSSTFKYRNNFRRRPARGAIPDAYRPPTRLLLDSPDGCRHPPFYGLRLCEAVPVPLLYFDTTAERGSMSVGIRRYRETRMPLGASTLLREAGAGAKTFSTTRSEPAVPSRLRLSVPSTEWLHRSFPWDTYIIRFLSIYTSQ